MVNDADLLADALRKFYLGHGLPPDGGDSMRSVSVRVGPFPVRFPNFSARKRAVFYHDINHTLTGYNTIGLDGEVVIAGFELGSGCGPFWVAWVINLGAFAVALVVQPRKLFAAFVRGRKTTSIYRCKESKTELTGLTVVAVKKMLNLDATAPLATPGDRLAFAGWTLLSAVLVAAPLLLAAAVYFAVRS